MTNISFSIRQFSDRLCGGGVGSNLSFFVFFTSRQFPSSCPKSDSEKKENSSKKSSQYKGALSKQTVHKRLEPNYRPLLGDCITKNTYLTSATNISPEIAIYLTVQFDA